MSSPVFDRNVIFSPSLCGHFALGAFSRTCLKDAVFDVKCLMKKCRKNEKIKNVNFDMKIKNRITTRYHFCSINTFWYPSNHFFDFLKLYVFGINLVYFWYISRAEFLPPTVRLTNESCDPRLQRMRMEHLAKGFFMAPVDRKSLCW